MTLARSLVALILTAVAIPASAADAPVVYAHRGGADLAPENTLGAFRQAHALFGDRGVWLEMDAQLSSDGKLVVIHDHTLDRTTECTGTVISRTAGYIADCDARDGWPSWPTLETVPLLGDLLTEGKTAGWRVMIELKNIPYESNFDAACASADTLVDLLAQTQFPVEQVVVQSFWPVCLERVKLRDPRVRVAMLTTSEVAITATENGVFSTARSFEIVAPNHTAPDLNATTVSAIQALGREVVVWTVDDAAEDIPRAIGWGVDGIISNRPDLVYAALD